VDQVRQVQAANESKKFRMTLPKMPTTGLERMQRLMSMRMKSWIQKWRRPWAVLRNYFSEHQYCPENVPVIGGLFSSSNRKLVEDRQREVEKHNLELAEQEAAIS
jgi:hypothetical protein